MAGLENNKGFISNVSEGNVICFHNPDEENGYLSNWFRSDFIVNGICYTSMEQFMMHKKAICFSDDVVAAEILKTFPDITIVSGMVYVKLLYMRDLWQSFFRMKS